MDTNECRVQLQRNDLSDQEKELLAKMVGKTDMTKN